MGTFEGYVGIRLWDGQLVDDVVFSLLFVLFMCFALVERLLVEFLALSSSAPLVYWLGCLCSLVALLVVLLLVRLEVWFLQLVLRFSLRFSMV